MSLVQTKVYRALLRPDCYLRETTVSRTGNARYLLVGSGKYVYPIVYTRTVQALLNRGHIKWDKRQYSGTQRVGYFAVPPC
jgi:hypothetical protein